MRPFGPIRGVILRVTGMGGVPVALPVPEEWWPPKWPRLSDCSSEEEDSLLDSLESCLAKCRLGLDILAVDIPETLAAEEPMTSLSPPGGSMDNLSLN